MESGEGGMLKVDMNGNLNRNWHGSRRGSVNGNWNGEPSLGRRTANLFGLGHRKEKEGPNTNSTNGSRVWEMSEG